MMKILRIFAICVLVGLYTANSKAQIISTYSLDNRALVEGKRRVINGDKSVSAAVEKLKISAERLLKSPNVNVTQKKEGWEIYFPKGYSIDSHEYVSFSIYFYPDTAKGKTWQDPWINIEKFGANDSMRYKFDNYRNSSMANRITTLAKAWWFINDQRFARAAVSQIREWFLNPETRMLPQMNHAQIVPFHPIYKTGSYWGMIEAMGYHEILNSIEMLKSSGEWTADDNMKMKSWIYDWTQWMRKNELAIHEGRKLGNNNHGIYYDIQLTTGWMYLANYKGINWTDSARIYISKIVPDYRILYQISDEGAMYLELHRPNASGYSCMCLKGFETLALIADKFNLDLWNWNSKAADKRCIRKAVEWLIPFYSGKKEWTYGNVLKNPLLPGNSLEIFWLSSRYLGGIHSTTFNHLILPTISENRLKEHEYNLLFPR